MKKEKSKQTSEEEIDLKKERLNSPEVFSTEGEDENAFEKTADFTTLDRESLINAFLSGSDEELKRLLKPLGLSDEDIAAAKEEFLTAARNSLYRRDLREILQKYELNIGDIKMLPNFEKYAALRANGFSAIEAFESANPRLAANIKSNGNRSHMSPITSRQGGTGDVPIPESELKLWQSAFPKASIEELTKRYNTARKN